jgi:D-alanyl-D-alanine carboxypeptidase
MQFLIASVSKVFASVAVQNLPRRENSRSMIPSTVAARGSRAKIPNGHMITVRQLLDHTSGIADYDEAAIILAELENPAVPVPYTVGIGQGLNASPLYAPGANWTYSNVNYNLLTLVVDKAAGMPYEEYVNKTILVPLGMKDTYLSHVNYFSKPHMSATVTLPDGTIVDYTNLYVEFDRGAGEIVSTAADLNRFHKALRDGKILSPASLKAMELPTPQSHRVNGDVISGYGLGYAIQKKTALDLDQMGHGGGYPAPPPSVLLAGTGLVSRDETKIRGQCCWRVTRYLSAAPPVPEGHHRSQRSPLPAAPRSR